MLHERVNRYPTLIKYAPFDAKEYLWSAQLYARFGKQEQSTERLRKGLKPVARSPSDERYNRKL